MKKLLKKVTATLLSSAMVSTTAAYAADFVWTMEPSDIGSQHHIASYNNYYEEIGTGIRFAETKKLGTVDKYGKTIIPGEYTNLGDVFGGKYIKVFSDKGVGILDSKGKTVIEFGKYNSIEKAGEDVAIVEQDKLFGIIDLNGKILTPVEYSEITVLDDNYFAAKKDNKYGIIDKNGKIIAPFEHQYSIKPLIDDVYVVGSKYNEKEHYTIDKNGKVLLKEENVSAIQKYAGDKIRLIYEDYSLKVIDRNGNPFDDHGYEISDTTDDYYFVLKEGKAGLCDKNFNFIIPCKYTSLFCLEDGIFVSLKDNNSKAEYIDEKCNVLEKFNGFNIDKLENGYRRVEHIESQCYGLMDANGNFAVPCEYANLGYLGNGVYYFTTFSGKLGFAQIGTEGKKVTDYFEGITLTIGSNNAKAFNEDVTIDAAPIVRNGRTMLPARFVAEQLGAEVLWDDATQTVTINKKGGFSLKLTIGSTEAFVGAYPYQLDTAAFVENGRTYTPVRFIAENLGGVVSWDEATQTVKILKKN